MSASEQLRIEPIADAPSFLRLAAWRDGSRTREVASRRKLDTRQVLPYFVREGVTFAGLLERDRPSRAIRGASIRGAEAIGIDFARVDETADILSYGKAIFTEHTHARIDERALKLPLPSYARSIGYLTELSLPLLVGIEPPPSDRFDVTWDGGTHTIRFAPIDALIAEFDARGAMPHSEDLRILLGALARTTAPREGSPRSSQHDVEAGRWLRAQGERVWNASRLVTATAREPSAGFERLAEPTGASLRFLELRRVHHRGQAVEIVTPGSGVSLAMLPYVVVDGVPHVLLWQETRVAVLERHVRPPLFDTPMSARYVNATACFVSEEDAASLESARDGDALGAIVTRKLGEAFGRAVRVRSVASLGEPGEPCPSVSSELRYRVACELDPSSIGTLPDEVFVIAAPELSSAVGDGFVRDPVVVCSLLQLATRWSIDPFGDVRTGEPARRLAFLNAMTQGSIVQRRLQRYSSIEVEQLEAPTYARLMTLLQHEFGVRIAYPRSEHDRTFFKAAFRVFMAADREEQRALQGLHWSHDAFHFALGNFTPQPTQRFGDWYVSGEPSSPEIPPEGPAWETYSTALKAAEDEATFFSFWTLYSEKLSLARHVGKLTFFEALRDMGVVDRANAREIFDAVTNRAELPASVSDHRAYRERKEVRDLFAYMLGFREYHLKDIRAAWKWAARDAYRACFTRFAIYEDQLPRYLANVRAFQARLDAYPPGLNPLLTAAADVRVALCLRVWDVVKALKLTRAAAAKGDAGHVTRASLLDVGERCFDKLDGLQRSLGELRAAVVDAEIVPRNERTFEAIAELGSRIEAVRGELWDAVVGTKLLAADVVAAERVRELPE
jgi:hypothetical protein